MSKRDRAKGFSLIELLLVIAIIAVIGSIAVPSFIGQRQRAREIGDAQTNTRVIQMALEARRNEMGIYGAGGAYEYKADGTRSDPDIIPTFAPKGNSSMNYKITIGDNGLTYEIIVTDPVERGRKVLTADHTGELKK